MGEHLSLAYGQTNSSRCVLPRLHSAMTPALAPIPEPLPEPTPGPTPSPSPAHTPTKIGANKKSCLNLKLSLIPTVL